jgi:hypothetical protein
VLKQKLRNEQRFASLEALKEQIAKDVVTARQFFGVWPDRHASGIPFPANSG